MVSLFEGESFSSYSSYLVVADRLLVEKLRSARTRDTTTHHTRGNRKYHHHHQLQYNQYNSNNEPSFKKQIAYAPE
jgi:predicted restriction endonuclease